MQPTILSQNLLNINKNYIIFNYLLNKIKINLTRIMNKKLWLFYMSCYKKLGSNKSLSAKQEY